MFDLDTLKHMNNKKQEEWSDRDALPTGDPIGDVDPYVEDYNKWKKDQENYENNMKNRVLSPEGKKTHDGQDLVEEKKCNCGVAKTYKNHTLRMHSEWCRLRV